MCASPENTSKHFRLQSTKVFFFLSKNSNRVPIYCRINSSNKLLKAKWSLSHNVLYKYAVTNEWCKAKERNRNPTLLAKGYSDGQAVSLAREVSKETAPHSNKLQDFSLVISATWAWYGAAYSPQITEDASRACFNLSFATYKHLKDMNTDGPTKSMKVHYNRKHNELPFF